MKFRRQAVAGLAGLFAVALGASTVVAPSATASGGTFLGSLRTLTQLGSTMPPNGDVNPYGVALVATMAGKLVAGDVLVSNFNSKKNVQGTGTTLVEVSPSGTLAPFAKVAHLPAGMSCPGGIGLDTGLTILPGGWVVVGSLPTTKVGALPGQNPAGCLIVFSDNGTPVETITNRSIVGPWDLTSTATATSATLFVSNALGGNTTVDSGTPVAGNCTVVRIDLSLSATAPPTVVSTTTVGKDFPWKANKAALVLAPTGLAIASNGTLFVDNTQNNTISKITGALTRTKPVAASSSVITSGGGLNEPLGMTLAPNGDLVVVNGNDGNAVEVTPAGKQVAKKTVIKNGAGDLFGITLTSAGTGLLLANDGTNALDRYHG